MDGRSQIKVHTDEKKVKLIQKLILKCVADRNAITCI